MRTINKRLGQMLAVAVSSPPPPGLYILDCYMGRQIRSDYSHAITTRTAEDSNTFVLEIYEDMDDSSEREGPHNHGAEHRKM